ncbi:MAG TPA: glycogen debranching N-terminal domain-containing protein [Jatrophihabitantaceae bacterium]|nr:glycogen debranching N-terminal domain-containing protein [Jatrophihabitantaceae bacterium]
MTLVEGSTFCVGDATGDIHAGRAHGLFVRDTRVLSDLRLTIDDVTPSPLTVLHSDPFAATHIARLAPGSGQPESRTLLVVRRRYVGNGMREDISVRNLALRAVQCHVRLAVAADFADLFEVKEGRAQPAPDVRSVPGESELRLARRRGSRTLGVTVSTAGRAQLSTDSLTWIVSLPPHGEWTTSVEVVPEVDGTPLPLRHPRGSSVEHTGPARRLRAWRARSPEVDTADPGLAAVLARSVEDLGALRIYDPQHPERAVVAAGAPWFMALFGRDSLLTSWMLLPLDASLAVGTMQTLAEHQGARVDAASEEEPGRILHEIRFGPSSDFALGGRTVYYGTADATPLFVMLLGELQRWGSDPDAVAALLPHADRALEWIENYGDADGDGFVEYRRKTPAGLANQGWKDSWDGITFADGRVAEAPIALAEVQAYCYAAFRARAHFAANSGDQEGQRHWLDRAATLKRTFNESFWLPDRGWFALGLDADKRPIDALTSNIGHCLWTGIVDADKAASVADRLLSPAMFTGWGIRTLASNMAAYNPISYHNGSVWPHDNALCAAGLMRYGFVQQAQRVITGLLDAAAHFNHRLPELFCGFGADEFAAPVTYPTSCSPQAWAAATPFSLLRSLLRFDPELPAHELWCAPAVPERYLPLRISGLHVAGLDVDVEVSSHAWRVAGLAGSGLALVSPG